jgi:hypothetical protein
MSNLSELLPSGGGQNAVDFVASGTITSGEPVALNLDGTVSPIGATTYTSSTIGTASDVFPSQPIYSAYVEGTGKVVTVGERASDDYPSVKATYLDADRQFQEYSLVVVESSTSISQTTVGAFKSSNSFLVLYNRVGTVRYKICTDTGSTITVGSENNWVATSGGTNNLLRYNALGISENKMVISHGQGDASGRMIVTVVEYSGGTAFNGASAQIGGSLIGYNDLCETSNPNVVVASWTNGGIIYACVLTISGLSVSVGSTVNTGDIDCSVFSSCYDATNDQIVFAFYQSGTNVISCITATVSGDTLTFVGSPATIETPASTPTAASFPTQAKLVATNGNNFAFGYSYDTSFSGTRAAVAYFSMSGTTPTSEGNFNASGNDYIALAYSSYQDAVFVAYGSSTTVGVQARNYPHTGPSNYPNFIGLSASGISDTATGVVNVYGGINEAQTGLTIGADYYVQEDGTLSTTVSSIKAGQAISATTINMVDLT